MTKRDVVSPPTDTWVAAIHRSQEDLSPLGAGVVIGSRHVLTCAHNVVTAGDDGEESLWVDFPTAETAGQRRRVVQIALSDNPLDDIAILLLDDQTPPGVRVAPLRRPRPSDLTGGRWWAFGFPDEDPVGDSAQGRIKGPLSRGWIGLEVANRERVAVGFSGSGVWSPDYEAVVGIINQVNPQGDARAITLYQVDRSFRDEKLGSLFALPAETAGQPDHAASGGWTLASDPEAPRHWGPRARGVAINSERGFRFRGRAAALKTIADWLVRPEPDRRVLVVTGSPGVGKSAVLSRIVTTADVGARAMLPSADTAVRAHIGSVACAVHASGKDALEVAAEIARASSARLPDRPEDIALALRDALTDRDGRFNVIVDALDEAATPADARTIILKILLPLAETCSDIGVQVVVGSRGYDDDGHLLGAFGEALTVIDLDDPRYFAESDLAAYAKANLQLAGDERLSSPYHDDAIASVLALRIAELADRNFLIGGLVARAHGLYDQQAADPEHLGFTSTVGSALTAFLARISPTKQVPPRIALTALALAEAPGWPIELWGLAIEAIGGIQVAAEQLSQFARSAAANFLIETGTDGAVFRLFHQALNEALLQERSRIVSHREDERALYQTFVRLGRQRTWGNAPAYLLRSLGSHAVGAGMIDELLSEEAYLLNADLRRLMPLAEQAISRPARLSTRLMRLTPQAVTADPATRTALFSVTSVLEDLGRSYSDPSAPYRATWASVIPHSERAVLDDHTGEVSGICALTVNNQVRLATAGKDSLVRIWDPSTGQLLSAAAGHTDWIRAICPFDLDGRALLASAGDDQIVRIWNPATDQLRVVLRSQTHMPGSGEYFNQGTIYALCAFSVAEEVSLASAGAYQGIRVWDPVTGRLRFTLRADVPGHDEIRGLCALNLADQMVLAAAHGNGTIRIWDLTTQRQLAALQGHTGVVKWVCPFIASEQVLLASAGGDGTVRIWDPATGQQQATLEGHSGWVNGVCSLTIDDHVLLASVGADGTARIWDPPIRQRRAATRSSAGLISGVCKFTLGGQAQLASAGADGTIRIWDAVTGHQQATLEGHNSASSVCALTFAGQVRLASAGEDGTVRIWDPAASKMVKVLQAHDSLVNGICAFELDGQTRLASGSADRVVRIWDPVSGQLKTALEGHAGGVNSVCAFTYRNQVLLATGSADRVVRIWDPVSGQLKTALEGHAGGVNSVCAFTSGSQVLLASASADHSVRIWHPDEGLLTILNGHSDWVSDVSAFSLGDLVLLATASLDRTVRIFDPLTAVCLGSIPVHHAAQAVCSTGKLLAIGLSAGLIAIELAEDMYMPWA